MMQLIQHFQMKVAIASSFLTVLKWYVSADCQHINASTVMEPELMLASGKLDWIVQCFTSPPTQYRLVATPNVKNNQ